MQVHRTHIPQVRFVAYSLGVLPRADLKMSGRTRPAEILSGRIRPAENVVGTDQTR
jgi:hypothetical protein